MKELSIQEKAKRYDEAKRRGLDYIRLTPATELVTRQSILEHIFPELKESEDEKIKQLLLRFVKYDMSDNYSDDFTPADCIAWLEKQSTPQVRTGLEWVNTIDDACDKRYSEEYAHGEYCHEQSFKWGFQEGVDWLEKQKGTEREIEGNSLCNGEQKPTDKVKPTFKVGDWVINKQGIVHQIANVIENVTNHTYAYDIVGSGYFNDNTEGVRLWTIQDAKDGDVLATLDHILIFEKLLSKDGGVSYCHYDFGCSTPQFNFNKDDNWYFGKEAKVYPATKEQRDLLFQKMHEAGYSWDAKKKELKKIKKAPQKFMVGDTIKYNGTEYKITEITPNGYKVYALTYDEDAASLISFSAPAILVEQNPAWSEEDEKMFEHIIAKATLHFSSINYLDEEEINFLKSLKDRVQPQLKQEWSEDDEQYLLVCKNALRKYQVTDKWDSNIISQWLDNKLKSLRPQNTCKPSDGQIKACKEVYADILSAKGFDLGTINSELNRLEEKLKKHLEE